MRTRATASYYENRTKALNLPFRTKLRRLGIQPHYGLRTPITCSSIVRITTVRSDCPDSRRHATEPRMLNRRSLLATSLSAVVAAPASAAPDGFQNFLLGVRAEARRSGIAQATLDHAFAGVQPNPKVIERDRHQPEFTLTWAEYRARLVSDQRIANGRIAYQQNSALLGRVRDRYGVDPGVITGIWGLESNFGTGMGDFHVVEALATLAWEGRRTSFFRGELIAALRILDHGDVTPAHMLGSYAGAMGH